ncbi:MAG: helix-turn-helix transcriptional regulator [Ruminococcaceae bacterium]|nr:helix-turn-helix transcriptional regulator [Oscillospiraceae bacterium]
MTGIKIGKKIRLLRKKNDTTQEKLAEYLKVTPQAVSRWESEICYPDIETLPLIADFFGVGMDELLCYDSVQKEAKIKDYLERAERLEDSESFGECLELLREAYAEIPSSFEIQLELAKVLSAINVDKPKKADLAEAISLCNHVLDYCTDDELRDETKKTLCDIYSHQLRNDKAALDIAEKLHSMDYSKEIVKATVLTGEIAFKQAQTNIVEFADNIWWHIYNISCVPDIAENNYTLDQKIQVMKKGIDLFEVIFGDGLLYYNDRIANSYRQLAMLYLMQGDRVKALDCVEKMAQYAIAFDTRPDSANYTSILINKVEHVRSGDISLCSKLLRGRFSSRIWAPIKNEPRFIAAVQSMEKHI